MQPVSVSQKHKMLVVPFAPEVANMFPAAKQLSGGAHLALPHGLTETYLLRKLGYDAPSPILSHYGWANGKPFDVQKKTCAMLALSPRAFVLNDMGTGKTKCPLWTFDYFKSNGLANKMLVLAPLSTLTFTWQREVFSTTPHLKCVVLHGTKEKRLQRLAEDADVYIINHDGLAVIHDELLKRPDIDTLVVDELAVYRSGQAARTKRLIKFAQRKEIKWIWGMTGSPMPNAPTDVWAQCRIVNPSLVPPYFSRFRDDMMLSVPNAPFKWRPKPDAVERAYAVMQPAVRFTLDDVVELPDLIERTVDVELGAKQEKIYKTLATAAYAAVSGSEITAVNAGAMMSKLLQISTGWVYDKDGKVVPLDNDKRVDALMDAIASTSRKVLVFVPFKHALAGISAAVTREGIEHAVVSGDTPAGARAEIFNLFQNTEKFRVMIAHPQCLAHGITLTSADTVIWFAPITDLEIFEQANRRIRRVGQKHKQQYIYLQSTPVERKVYTALRNKQKVQERFLDLFAEATKEAT